MRFQKSFSRTVVAAGTTTLGTDSVPTSKPTGRDNQLSASLNNINGFPIQRFVVAYKGPANAQPLPATLYLYDDETDSWFQCGDEQMLIPGAVQWFDQPTLGAMAWKDSSGNTYSPGSLDLCLVVSKPAGPTDPDGTYRFAMGMDLSNSFDNVKSTLGGTVAAVTLTQNVATALATTRTAAEGIILQADPANTSPVWIGDSNVAASRGIMLNAYDPPILLKTVSDLSRLYGFSAGVSQKVIATLP